MSFNYETQQLQCDYVKIDVLVDESPTCSACIPGRDFNGFRAERNARTAALEQGWQIAVRGNNLDFCPVHSTEPKQA